MTMLTMSYKKHYIHVNNISKTEQVQVQILDNPLETYGTFKLYTVKSLQAAKLLITKHVKA